MQEQHGKDPEPGGNRRIISRDAEEPDTIRNEPRAARNVYEFNLIEISQINKDQVRALSTLPESFARTLTNSLGACLRVGIDFDLVSVEQLTFSEIISRLPDLTHLCSTRMQPLEALRLLQMDIAVAFPIMDLVLGGPGTALLAKGLNCLSGGNSTIERALRTCEDSACREELSLWTALDRKDEGICPQRHWYCSTECFEQAAVSAFLRPLPGAEVSTRKHHRIPIGLLLLPRGTINDAQLKRALLLRRESGSGKIGKFLREIRAASEQEITKGLAAQWGCPVRC